MISAAVGIAPRAKPRPFERGIAAHPGFEMLVQQVPEYLRFFGLAELGRRLQDDLSEVRALLVPR